MQYDQKFNQVIYLLIKMQIIEKDYFIIYEVTLYFHPKLFLVNIQKIDQNL